MPEPIQLGAFIPTTNIWDINDIKDNKERQAELLVRLYQNISTISTILNQKDTGYYVLQPFINGQQFFPTRTNETFRPVFRMTVDFGALPNNTTKSVAHGITFNNSFIMTRIYACASDPVSFTYIPIPFASPTLANNISITIDATNVTIVTGSNRTNFTTCYVIFEYIQF